MLAFQLTIAQESQKAVFVPHNDSAEPRCYVDAITALDIEGNTHFLTNARALRCIRDEQR